MVIDIGGAHTPQAEDDHTGKLFLAGCNQLSKIEITGEQDLSLTASLLQNSGVRQPLEALLTQVHRLVLQTA
jgi:hypothetical protein